MIKRLLAMLLCLCMVVTLMPLTAFAAEKFVLDTTDKTLYVNEDNMSGIGSSHTFEVLDITSLRYKCSWSVDDSSIVDINGKSISAIVTAKKAGKATLTCKVIQRGSDTVEATLTATIVVRANAASVSITNAPNNKTMKVGETFTFVRTMAAADGGEATDKTEWSTSDETVGTITKFGVDGVFTAISAGTVSIYAKTYQSSADFTIHGYTAESEAVIITVTNEDIAVPSAVVGSVTVSGTVGTEITPSSTAITLTNDKFKALAAETNVSSWFTNLPAGLAAKISSSVSQDDTTATVTLYGEPTAASAATMTVTIPAASLVGNADLAVTSNANAKWNITAPSTTPYTYTAPASITQNGVTASVTFDKASPQTAGTEVTATVTLTGTAAAAGTHTINLSSAKASLSGTAQNITVTAGQASFTVPSTYSLTVPAQDVDDLTLTHDFVAKFGSEIITEGGGILAAGANTSDAATVYYGKDSSGTPYTWRVIGYSGTGVAAASGNMTLLSDGTLLQTAFNSSNTDNAYAGSTLKTKVEEIAAGLTAKEQPAVAKRTLAVGTYTAAEPFCDGVAGAEVTDAMLWPLSTTEANTMDSNLRIADSAYTSWWLRSPGSTTSYAAVVPESGNPSCSGLSIASTSGIRPAFNLNLNAVLMTSAAVGGKSVAGMGTALTAVPATETAEWKLTVIDADRNFAAETTEAHGNTLMISYSGAKTGTNEYISAILKDSSGSITHYGRIKNITDEEATSGTVDITLPADMTGKTLYVFSEQYNGDYETDYASAFQPIDVTVVKTLSQSDGVVHYTFDSIPADAATLIIAQYNTSGKMKDVWTTAANITGDSKHFTIADGDFFKLFVLDDGYAPVHKVRAVFQ